MRRFLRAHYQLFGVDASHNDRLRVESVGRLAEFINEHHWTTTA